MTASFFSRSELDAALELVAAHMQPTPQYRWPLACARAGCEVWLKHENHTATGAFKVRGGLVFLNNLMRGVRGEPLVTPI